MNHLLKSNQVLAFLESLDCYEDVWRRLNSDFFKEQQSVVEQFKKFINEYPNPFDRECLFGHVTGSGFVVNYDFSKMLLTHHKKLDKWLQLGGHCDGDENVYNVALKECKEESGLTSFEDGPIDDFLDRAPDKPIIFDLDIHLIPEYKQVTKHYHFDVRYLFIADDSKPVIVSSESKDVKWHPITDILHLNSERSIARPLKKISLLSKELKNNNLL